MLHLPGEHESSERRGKLDETEAARALLARHADVHDGYDRLSMGRSLRPAQENAGFVI